jgi:hypothetical protein
MFLQKNMEKSKRRSVTRMFCPPKQSLKKYCKGGTGIYVAGPL